MNTIIIFQTVSASKVSRWKFTSYYYYSKGNLFDNVMKPLFHPQLVNDPFGDPALYIDYLFEKRALMFDLGNIEALATRKVLRVSHIFVSHAHMDHFIGFDRVLRLCLGREKALFIYGPPGFVAQVENKLGGYTWNLVHNYETDFTVIAVEIHPGDKSISARFRCRTAFKREDLTESTISDGILIDEEGFRIRTTPLDHKTICLAFVLEEKQHINVWKNRLDEMGLPTGPWLRELKKTILRGEPDSTPYRVWWRENQMTREQYFPLGELKEKILHIVPGQKIGYVVDTVYHAENIRRIIELVAEADILFIETAFTAEEASRAAETYHLTTYQAGEIARRAAVKRIVPFHFSVRYSGMAPQLYREVEEAFSGGSGMER